MLRWTSMVQAAQVEVVQQGAAAVAVAIRGRWRRASGGDPTSCSEEGRQRPEPSADDCMKLTPTAL